MSFLVVFNDGRFIALKEVGDATIEGAKSGVISLVDMKEEKVYSKDGWKNIFTAKGE